MREDTHMVPSQSYQPWGAHPHHSPSPTMSISLVRELTRSETEERGSVLRSDSSCGGCPGTGAVVTALPPAGNLGKERQGLRGEGLRAEGETVRGSPGTLSQRMLRLGWDAGLGCRDTRHRRLRATSIPTSWMVQAAGSACAAASLCPKTCAHHLRAQQKVPRCPCLPQHQQNAWGYWGSHSAMWPPSPCLHLTRPISTLVRSSVADTWVLHAVLCAQHPVPATPCPFAIEPPVPHSQDHCPGSGDLAPGWLWDDGHGAREGTSQREGGEPGAHRQSSNGGTHQGHAATMRRDNRDGAALGGPMVQREGTCTQHPTRHHPEPRHDAGVHTAPARPHRVTKPPPCHWDTPSTRRHTHTLLEMQKGDLGVMGMAARGGRPLTHARGSAAPLEWHQGRTGEPEVAGEVKPG